MKLKVLLSCKFSRCFNGHSIKMRKQIFGRKKLRMSYDTLLVIHFATTCICLTIIIGYVVETLKSARILMYMYDHCAM